MRELLLLRCVVPLEPEPALDDLPRKMLLVGGQRLSCLLVEILYLLLDMRCEQLQALLGRDHIGDRAPKVLEVLQVPLVDVLERQVRESSA